MGDLREVANGWAGLLQPARNCGPGEAHHTNREDDPGAGGTGATKESLQWLALPSSGLCCIGLLTVAAFAGRALFSKPHTDAS